MGTYEVSRARLSRAITHGESIASTWNAIPDSDLYTVQSRVDLQGHGSISLLANKPIPEIIPLLIGEMVYQLRAALDSLIYQAAIYISGQDPPPDEQKLEFPVATSRDDFYQLARRRLPGFPKSVIDGIEGVQPYNAPPISSEETAKSLSRALGLLHNWARIDRHRRLHLVTSYATAIDPEIKVPDGVVVKILSVHPTDPLDGNPVLVTFSLQGFNKGMRVRCSPNLSTNLEVNEAGSRSHESDTLQNRLQSMLDLINSVTGAFEKYV